MSAPHPIIRQIVDRCHVSRRHRAVARYVISRLREGWTTYRAMPREDRREMLRQIHQVHQENRAEYRAVMSGRFTQEEPDTCDTL